MNKIYYFTPYSLSRNIGEAYNEYMEMIKDPNDFACFIDGDTRFCYSLFGHQIQGVINDNPDLEYATCKTNRVYCSWQLVKNAWDLDEADKHNVLAAELWAAHKTEISDKTNKDLMSGVMILLKKSAWLKYGRFRDGMLGVDNDYHQRVKNKGGKLYLMEGIYLYHWYRGGVRSNKNHLLDPAGF